MQVPQIKLFRIEKNYDARTSRTHEGFELKGSNIHILYVYVSACPVYIHAFVTFLGSRKCNEDEKKVGPRARGNER